MQAPHAPGTQQQPDCALSRTWPLVPDPMAGPGLPCSVRVQPLSSSERRAAAAEERVLHLDVSSSAVRLLGKASEVRELLKLEAVVHDDSEPASIIISCR